MFHVHPNPLPGRTISYSRCHVMRFFTKKVLQDLEEREKELALHSRECLETTSLEEIARRLNSGIYREETKVAAAAAQVA